MTWQVNKINTQTGQVTMIHKDGSKHELIIPSEHREYPHLANDFLTNACKAHEKSLTHEVEKEVETQYNSHLLFWVSVIPSIIVIVWFILRAAK